MYTCRMQANWWTKVQTKCRPSVDQVYITLQTKPTTKQLRAIWLDLQRYLHLVDTWSAPVTTNWSLCGMRIQFIIQLTVQKQVCASISQHAFKNVFWWRR